MRRHSRIASRIATLIIGVATLACGRQHRTTPLAGQYVRSSVRLIEDGQLLPTPADGPFTAGFPSNMQLDKANGFEVQAGEGQLTGRYRMQRDSIFFDQDTGSETRLAFAGRVLDDTIDVHWIPASGRAASNYDVQLRFVRAK
jgi:hypothetical protein